MAKKSIYLRLEGRIAADERGGIMHRWEYGRQLLKAKAGRKQLPHGLLGDLVKAAIDAGLKLSEREIQRRIKCATVYDSEAKVRRALADFGSWSALDAAGFPAVVVDEPGLDPDEMHDGPPDAWEQMTLIPGFKETVKVRGREIPLGEATVGEAVDYREKYRQMHEGFAKTLALIEVAVEAMLDGSGGDLDANAVEAWRRATDKAEE